MHKNRRKFIKSGVAAGTIGLTGCTGSVGGEYPNQSITMVVPWAQGGGTDRSTRALTPTWSDTIDGDFSVQNYPGGGTQVGGEKLYNADADGYTLGMWNLPQMQATWLFQNAPYKQKDFEFIGTNHADPTMWFAPLDSDYSDMNGFLDYARKNNVKVGLTSAVGNTALSALLVLDTYDVNMDLVNLEGGTPVRQAVLAGDVDAAVNQPWAFNPSNIGDVTPLGSHTPEQQELWPDTPSFAELGLKDLPLVEDGLVQWKLMVAPAGLQDEYPDRWDTIVSSYKEAMQADSYRKRAAKQGNLDKIINYNGPDKTKQIVSDNTKFMKKYKPLFDKHLG